MVRLLSIARKMHVYGTLMVRITSQSVMQTFLAFCEDQAEAKTLRAQYLEPHLAYVESVMDHIQVAGPLREDGSGNIGASCFIYRCESLDDARALLEQDPYFRSGVYQSVRWFHLNPAAGQWVGGRNW